MLESCGNDVDMAIKKLEKLQLTGQMTEMNRLGNAGQQETAHGGFGVLRGVKFGCRVDGGIG